MITVLYGKSSEVKLTQTQKLRFHSEYVCCMSIVNFFKVRRLTTESLGLGKLKLH